MWNHIFQASEQLKKLHHANLCRKYRLSLSPADKEQLELKVLAEKTFKGKKKSYEKSVGAKFLTDRLEKDQKTFPKNFNTSILSDKETMEVKKVFFNYYHGWEEKLLEYSQISWESLEKCQINIL